MSLLIIMRIPRAASRLCLDEQPTFPIGLEKTLLYAADTGMDRQGTLETSAALTALYARRSACT